MTAPKSKAIPALGAHVQYLLSAEDANAINRRRTTGASIAARIEQRQWPIGAQAHIGDEAREGDAQPMTVVALDIAKGTINGQVLLNGNDSLWVRAVIEGTKPGTWRWPQEDAAG